MQLEFREKQKSSVNEFWQMKDERSNEISEISNFKTNTQKTLHGKTVA